MSAPADQILVPVHDYDLAATLTSGQAFRWQLRDGWWEGVIGEHWVRLQQRDHGIAAETPTKQRDWSWMLHYLQTDLDLNTVLLTFPQDEPMRASIEACRGLRLLQQDPWECLASFILSSTKQIVQIRQIVGLLCERYGKLLPTMASHEPVHAFPSAERLASTSEAELRECKMGFRAPYLLAAAQQVASREIDLLSLFSCDVDAARDRLMELPGVGNKIANCVLLFAYGFQQAFPVDVWVMKALRELYFPKRQPSPERLGRFVSTYFGTNAGYAQQYLFHYMRTKRPGIPTASIIDTSREAR